MGHWQSGCHKLLPAALRRPMKRKARNPARAVKRVVRMNFLDVNSFFIRVSSFHSWRLSVFCSLKFGVVVAGQFHGPGNGRIGVAEHVDIELDIAGEHILHPVACHMERKSDIPYPVVIRGERDLAGEAVCHHVFQHGGIIAAGVEGI